MATESITSVITAEKNNQVIFWPGTWLTARSALSLQNET